MGSIKTLKEAPMKGKLIKKGGRKKGTIKTKPKTWRTYVRKNVTKLIPKRRKNE